MKGSAGVPLNLTDSILQPNHRLRERLELWQQMLDQAVTGNYVECQHAISVLRELCNFLEQEASGRLRKEEESLYPLAEVRNFQLRKLVNHLRQEHEAFRASLKEFRRELVCFNTTGDLNELHGLGYQVVRILLRHMAQEESELLPALVDEPKSHAA